MNIQSSFSLARHRESEKERTSVNLLDCITKPHIWYSSFTTLKQLEEFALDQNEFLFFLIDSLLGGFTPAQIDLKLIRSHYS